MSFRDLGVVRSGSPIELMRNPPILGGADRNGNQILQV